MTTLEQLETIEDDETRHAAIIHASMDALYCSELLSDECFSLYDALISGFVWADTPEGHSFWVKIAAEQL